MLAYGCSDTLIAEEKSYELYGSRSNKIKMEQEIDFFLLLHTCCLQVFVLKNVFHYTKINICHVVILHLL